MMNRKKRHGPLRIMSGKQKYKATKTVFFTMLEKNNIKKGIRTLFTVDRMLTNKLFFLSNGIIFTWKGIYSIQ